MKRIEKLVKILENCNYGSQMDVATEELAECIQAIIKIKRYGGTEECMDHLAEEIADVYIMLQQVRILNNVDKDKILKWIDKKLDRTIKRLGLENGN